MPEPLVVTPQTAPPPLQIVGEELTILASGGKGGGVMISMTSCEGASHMFTDFDREIAPDAPDVNKLIDLGRPYGLAVTLPPA